MPDPDPFDPWDAWENVKPRHKRICRHGRVQFACGWTECRNEAIDAHRRIGKFKKPDSQPTIEDAVRHGMERATFAHIKSLKAYR